MRTQISTNVSAETRKQADELIERCGYSLRDVVTVAIEKLHIEKIQQEENKMQQHTSAMRDDESRYALRVEKAEVVPANYPEIGGYFVCVYAGNHEALLIEPSNCSEAIAQQAATEIIGQKVVFCG